MATFATTLLNCIPLRASDSHRSEMVSQVLFGEVLEIIDERNDFYQVVVLDVAYEGWVQKTQLVPLPILPSSLDGVVGLDPVFVEWKGQRRQLYPGTRIALETWRVENQPVRLEGEPRIPELNDFDSYFSQLLKAYIGTPYLWGGRTQAGIDCSGFSQSVYAQFGVALRRDAYQQAEQGTLVDFLPEIKAGDLAFFDNAEGRITHVGIMIDPETIIHASGEVRIDSLDSEGIFNKDLNKYTHKLRIIKRYF